MTWLRRRIRIFEKQADLMSRGSLGGAPCRAVRHALFIQTLEAF